MLDAGFKHEEPTIDCWYLSYFHHGSSFKFHIPDHAESVEDRLTGVQPAPLYGGSAYRLVLKSEHRRSRIQQPVSSIEALISLSSS